MESPGVETRPIKLISGASPFCETFLTDVHVPAKNVIFEVNKGWTVAKSLLNHERNMIASALRYNSRERSKHEGLGQGASRTGRRPCG